MKQRWKLFIPAGFFFLASFGLLLYAFVLAPESEITPEETARVEAMFAGIPQKGSVLGNKDSKETIIVFADMQCPYCAQFSKEGLRHLLPDVRKGNLKLDLRILGILGPDSLKAAEAAQALASQNRMWQFSELFFLNQGDEGSGYVSDSFIQQIYNALNIDEELMEASREEASRRVALDDNLAFRSGIRGTPSFIFLTKDGEIQPLPFPDFTEKGIQGAIEKARRN